MDILTKSDSSVVKFTTSVDNKSLALMELIGAGEKDFTDVDLSGSELSGVVIFGGRFGRSGFSDTVITNCVFSKCSFTKVDFKNVRFVDCIFSDCTFIGADLTDSTFHNTTLEGSLERATGLCSCSEVKQLFKFDIACNPTNNMVNLGCWNMSIDELERTTYEDYRTYIREPKYEELRPQLDKFIADYKAYSSK